MFIFLAPSVELKLVAASYMQEQVVCEKVRHMLGKKIVNAAVPVHCNITRHYFVTFYNASPLQLVYTLVSE